MIKEIDVQNGTYKHLGKDVGIVAAVNSDSNINVSVYLSERDKYKTEFNSWSKKTAQSTLEMCRVVYEAKQVLSKEEFKKFSSEINARSTITKYLAIGAKYDNFYQYAELLPNSWTSIYEITQLPSETFEALVATENSLANMTGDQLKQLMGKKTEDKSKSSAESAATPTTLAPQTAQNTQEAHEDINAASNTTAQPATATATSGANQTDSVESSADVATASVDTASDEPSSESDRQFAKHATSTMLERVAATASTHVKVEAEDVFEPYEITIRFGSKPSDVAVAALVESIVTIKSKYRLDFEFMQQKFFVE